MSSTNHRYVKSTNPFDEDEEDDIDDELFLRGSRHRPPGGPQGGPSALDEQLQSFAERKRAIEDRTLNSTEKSIGILRESEQIGIATAEELLRQREKLEKTDKQLDEINATLRFSQKHINGIKSVFSSLKNYMSGKSEASSTGSSTPSTVKPSNSTQNLEDKFSTYDRYDNHPATRLRGTDYSESQTQSSSSSGSKDFSARLDANLQEMCTNISRLKGLAFEMGSEIESQNDLIGNITDKTERADLTINKQNKEMNRILKK